MPEEREHDSEPSQPEPWTCDACHKVMGDGDVMLTLSIAEELIHGRLLTEPVNLVLSKVWCRPCGERHIAFSVKALELRAVHAGPHKYQ